MTANIFLKQLEQPTSTEEKRPASENIFLKQMEGMPPRPEGRVKSASRTALQVPLGFAKRSTWISDVVKLFGEGFAKDTLEELKETNPQFAEMNIDEELQKASKIFPTQERIEEVVEEKTGIPLQPKTELQKNLRLGGTAAGFRPGSAAAKTSSGVTAPLIKEGLKEVGVPETPAEFGGLLLSGAAPEIGVSKVKKPSGLTTRQFEKIEKPTKVSPGRHAKLNETLEKDFKGISDEILNKNPDYHSIKNDPNYRTNLNESFEKVQDLAESIPDKVQRRHLASFMKRRLKTEMREMKGITPKESEETFRKEFGDYLKKVSEGPEEFSIANLVEQYRKNNSELAEYFEPGKSKGFNTGRRDALLEYNRSIQELFDTVHPNSEFTNVFKEQNRRWSQLADAEYIEKRLGDIFQKDKINFKGIHNLLDKRKENYRRPFQRMMGKEGFKNFESLLKDFQSIEKPYSMLKKAETGGFKDLVKLAGSYIIHPSLAKLKATSDILRNAVMTLVDKPQLALTWKDGVDAFKAGKFPEAEEKFKELDSEVKKLSEKVKPFEKKLQTYPEEYSPGLQEKITETQKSRPYEFSPSLKEIKDFKLNEPPSILTKNDADRIYNYNHKPNRLTKDENIIYKNSWEKLFNKDTFNKYYNVKEGSEIGKVGDFIKDKKLRKIYKDVLDTPIHTGVIGGGTAEYLPNGKSIGIQGNISPYHFYKSLMHETHHALQWKYRRDIKFPYEKGNRESYLKTMLERKARLAERYAIKDMLKAKKTSQKVDIYGIDSEKRERIKKFNEMKESRKQKEVEDLKKFYES